MIPSPDERSQEFEYTDIIYAYINRKAMNSIVTLKIMILLFYHIIINVEKKY